MTPEEYCGCDTGTCKRAYGHNAFRAGMESVKRDFEGTRPGIIIDKLEAALKIADEAMGMGIVAEQARKRIKEIIE